MKVKLRVWNSELKKMIYPHDTIDIEHHQWFTKRDTIVYANMQNGYTSGDIMLFTGLLDKNGEEIYEGDILKLRHINWMGTENEEIAEELIIEVGYRELFASFYYADVNNEERDIMHFHHRSMDYEIIGNIYENEKE
jgi:uncharacterized phage protein (TIGR01671 family)